MEKRIKELMPIYSNIAVQFCDLQDTPGRMKAKNCINDIIEWKNSRKFFYYRLKRKILELENNKKIKEFKKGDFFERKKLFDDFVSKTMNDTTIFNDNEKYIEWIEKNGEEIIKFYENLKNEKYYQNIIELFENDKELTINSIIKFINSNNLTDEEKQKIFKN
jgi:acetyl-CoA carboxylase / biotin carboxylase 1